MKNNIEKKRFLPKVVFIVGPTASGKTALGLQLAQLYNGEIINADARQIYKKFSIGTGKPIGIRKRCCGYNAYLVEVPDHLKVKKSKEQILIPHYLMDFLPPEKAINLVDWRRYALKAIRGITKRNHLPIVVGGTGLYIKSLIDNYAIPPVEPNLKLRESFSKKSLDYLVNVLLKLDTQADTFVDIKNPRRVIRAIEIMTFTGKKISDLKKNKKPVIDALQLAIKIDRMDLNKKIDENVERMIADGWVQEVESLFNSGLKEDSSAMSSIGYREIGQYLKNKITLEEAVQRIKIVTKQYAKRQVTWFKKDDRIHYISTIKEAQMLIDKFKKQAD